MEAKQSKWCFVPDCTSTSRSTPGKIFISVPKEPKRKFLWFKAARRLQPTSQSGFFCCENHFNLEEDVENYMRYKLMGGRIILKKHVVPHIFDGQIDRKRPATALVRSAVVKRKRQQLIEDAIKSSVNISKKKVNQISSPIKVNMTDTNTLPSSKIKKRIFEAENSTSSQSESDRDPVKSDCRLKSSVQTTISYIPKNSKRYVCVTDAWFKHLVNFLHKRSGIKSEHILLTLLKIKLNDSFLRLGDQFDLSEGHASKIFKKSILMLAHLLKKLIYWPDKAKLINLMPIPFRARYHNVQSIIDCFEIQIEKPTDPFKQSLTWSENKKCNTLKYLISATPDGFINFISCGYGGGTSDTELFKQSGFLQQLPPGCCVMADRGFQKNIQKLVEDKKCLLVKPPRLCSNSLVKPNKDEVLDTKRIGNLRIHIERVIRRLREYEYLKPHSVIHHSLVDKTDDVITIACASINLQSSVLKQM